MTKRIDEIVIWKTSEAIERLVKSTRQLCRDFNSSNLNPEALRTIRYAGPPDFDEDVLLLFGRAFAANQQNMSPENPLRHGNHAQAIHAARDAFFALQDATNAEQFDRLRAIAQGHEQSLAKINVAELKAESANAKKLLYGVNQESELAYDNKQQLSLPAFPPSDVSRALGITSTTLNTYARGAGVNTPGRGKRNFRYSQADCEAICLHVIGNVSESKIRKKAQQFQEEIKSKSQVKK